MDPRSTRMWRHRRIAPVPLPALVLLTCYVLFSPDAKAQDRNSGSLPPAGTTSTSRSFRPVADVQVVVTSANKNLSDQEMLEALERTAQELRARLASATPASAAGDATPAGREPDRSPGPAPEGLSTTPAPADCDDNAPPEKTHGPATLLPSTLLWEPPLANPLQPRMALTPTTLHNEHTKATIDTAIGGEL